MVAVSLKKKREKTKQIIRVLLGRLFYLVGGILIGWAVFHARLSLVPKDTGYELFSKAHISGKPEFFDKRIEAAIRLARQKNSELWVVLLLLDRNARRYTLSQVDVERKSEIEPELEKFEKGVVAAVLMNIPKDAHTAVLLAVTTKLSDAGRGYYSTSKSFGPITYLRGDGETKPIREIARNTLKRCLEVDHGYNVVLWREAILQK